MPVLVAAEFILRFHAYYKMFLYVLMPMVAGPPSLVKNHLEKLNFLTFILMLVKASPAVALLVLFSLSFFSV